MIRSPGILDTVIGVAAGLGVALATKNPVKAMKLKISPFLWSGLVLVLSQVLTLFTAFREKLFFEANQITSPDISVAPALGYFFGMVVLLGLALFFVPLSKIKIILRLLIAMMFAWGAFIITALTSSVYIAYAMAVATGVVWFFWARIWLHDLLLILALAGAGSVFGFLFSPWTFMFFMFIVAVYDALAVRFGFMVWMADRLSESSTLPAFIFPWQIADWNLSLNNVRVAELQKQAPDKRQYSILGGGDIGFPLMLCVSVFFDAGLASAIVVAVSSLLGLMGAFLIQSLWLKGKPMPALPPITLASLIGFLIVTPAL